MTTLLFPIDTDSWMQRIIFYHYFIFDHVQRTRGRYSETVSACVILNVRAKHLRSGTQCLVNRPAIATADRMNNASTRSGLR